MHLLNFASGIPYDFNFFILFGKNMRFMIKNPYLFKVSPLLKFFFLERYLGHKNLN